MDFMEIRDLYHIEGNVGYSKETIRKAINKFGRLPSVLTDYYQQLGKHRGLNHSDYHLCEPGKLDFLVYGDYLCFYKREDPIYWYIDMEHLESDNPPVYQRIVIDSYTYVYDTLESDTLEEFLCVMAYYHAGFCLPYKSGVKRCTIQQVNAIEKSFQRKPYNLSKWPQFYGNDCDEVIMVYKENTYCQVSCACTSKEQLEKFKAVIG